MTSLILGFIAGYFFKQYWPRVWGWLKSKGVSFP